MTFNPTSEQTAALDLFSTETGLAIEAGAGAGKTSTLKLLAESTTRRGQYVAFNKAIVEEAARKMPETVTASTMHSLAFRAVGKGYQHRLGSKRMPSNEIARILGVDPIVTTTFEGKQKVLQPGYLASLAMRAIGVFCNSADPRPMAKHVPYIEGLDPQGENGQRGYARNNEISKQLADYLDRAWDDILSTDGRLTFTHDCYLKIFEQSAPTINADYVLFDEGQDASGVMTSIVFQQTDAQIVVVGDSQQAIYGWRGAVDAIQKFREAGCERATLSQSFRFGPAIADVANLVLSELDADLRLTGTDTIPSEVVPMLVSAADCLLTRTNAKAVQELLRLQRDGVKVHLMGGGKEVLAFARAASDLQAGRWTSHPDLAMFDSWPAVQAYVEDDPQGDELALLVRLVDEFGAPTIADALGRMPAEDNAQITVSTAHKSKGREWPAVVLADDFPNPAGPRGMSDEEYRLVYVAATRAQLRLDPSRCLPLAELLPSANRVEGVIV